MKYVIIGGDAAGMSAAMQIVRHTDHPEITTLERGGVYSYAQCGLPYLINGEVESKDKLIARKVESFREKHGIDARVFHHVTAVDPETKTVKGKNLKNNNDFEVPYDRLLIATGASPILPDWPGRDLQGVHTLKTIPDMERILEHAKDAKDVTIIGGGSVGLEVAETMTDTGRHVRMIERNVRIGTMFDKDMAHYIEKEAKEHRMELCLQESVEKFEGDGHVQKVITDKHTYDTDLVIVAIGIRPNTGFLEKTGVLRKNNGAIDVNAYMQTNVDDIYAAGDCATQFHRIKEKDDYLPLGTHANKQGRVAGLNLSGYPKAFQGVVGTAILRFFRLILARTGLSEEEAKAMNFPYDTITHEATHVAGYFTGKKSLYIKLVYRTDTDMILGGQIIGEEGADKRIDVLATALFHRMTLSEFEDLDLSYAPPFNGVWDPLQQAIRRSK